MRRVVAHQAALLSVLLVLAGFAVIGLSWRGAAAVLFVPTQVAFATSGGLAGLALIGAGGALLNAHLTRVQTARRSVTMRRCLEDSVAILDAVRTRGRRAP